MKVGEMFPNRFLRGQDFTQPLLIQIRGVVQETMRSGKGRPEETKFVLRFELVKGNKFDKLITTQHPPDGYGLILRKTLVVEIAQACGEPDTKDWSEKLIVIYPVREKDAGREVTVIHARARKLTQPDATPAQETTTES